VVLEKLQRRQVLGVLLGADRRRHDSSALPVPGLVDGEEEDDLVAGAEGLREGGRERGREGGREG